MPLMVMFRSVSISSTVPAASTGTARKKPIPRRITMVPLNIAALPTSPVLLEGSTCQLEPCTPPSRLPPEELERKVFAFRSTRPHPQHDALGLDAGTKKYGCGLGVTGSLGSRSTRGLWWRSGRRVRTPLGSQDGVDGDDGSEEAEGGEACQDRIAGRRHQGVEEACRHRAEKSLGHGREEEAVQRKQHSK